MPVEPYINNYQFTNTTIDFGWVRFLQYLFKILVAL